MKYYDELKKDKTYQKKVSEELKPFIKDIGESLNFSKFRYYQREAMNIFDFFYNQNDDYYFKEQLKENESYYYGFEMATGSGKTYLIGGNIIYLKSKGIKNFLILTPNTTVYHKTIRNFDINDKKCIFNGDLDFKYNLITGEDYTGRSNSYDPEIDINIFVFNIQKFFDRVKGERGESALKIKKAWEQGALKDEEGNSISLYDFLVNREIAVITDEAHHYQQNKSKKVIEDLKPNCVLEFTATAVEDESWRRKQKIIYKYSIDRYIGDGFGKKIRAFGHHTPELEKSEKVKVSKADKEKIIISLLIHQIKKKALKNLKPILVIRARDLIEHADNVLKYIIEELLYEDSLIEEVFEQLKVDEKYDIISLIRKNIPTVEEFKKELKNLKDKTISYHGSSSVEENEKLELIEENDIELVVQVKKLEEGWNVDGVYTILILNYGQSEIRTYVKQLIGRGLRLPKEKRENFRDSLLDQTETLHVICEKGNNFAEFIDQIKKDLELSGDSIDIEFQSEEYKNLITIKDLKRYNNLQLPEFSFESKLKFTANDILKQLTYEELKIPSFIKGNTHIFKKKKLLIFDEEGLNIEEGISDYEKELENKEKENKSESNLILIESDFSRLISQLISNNPVLPAVVATKDVLVRTLMNINKENLIYYYRYGTGEEKTIKKKLISKLYKHLSEQVDNMFVFESKIQNKQLKEIFKEEQIIKRTNPENKEIVNLLHNSRTVQKKEIKKYFFNGYKKSFYEYNWYESSHEKIFASIVDNCADVEFWIRNIRQYYLEYGIGKKYYPDFIIKTKKGIYIIEIKGTGFFEASKDNINSLKELHNKKDSEVQCILLMDKTIDSQANKFNSFEQINSYNELFAEKQNDPTLKENLSYYQSED
jgi:superfamily II DNA or RNA helicase